MHKYNLYNEKNNKLSEKLGEKCLCFEKSLVAKK